MPFTDIAPFDDNDAETWYKIGYSAGWNSIVGESRLTNQINFFCRDKKL